MDASKVLTHDFLRKVYLLLFEKTWKFFFHIFSLMSSFMKKVCTELRSAVQRSGISVNARKLFFGTILDCHTI